MLPLLLRAPGFHMPSDLSRPIVMIGPGTGIAPFRGFWQQRKVVTPSDPIGKSKLGRLTLFFGCQTKEMILYRSELEDLKKIGTFSDIYLALSREPKIKKVTSLPHASKSLAGSTKCMLCFQTYVQDLLIREGESMANQILKQGGHVYVCGDCTMAEDVYQTLKVIVQEHGQMNDTEVENYMLSLRVRGALILNYPFCMTTQWTAMPFIKISSCLFSSRRMTIDITKTYLESRTERPKSLRKCGGLL